MAHFEITGWSLGAKSLCFVKMISTNKDKVTLKPSILGATWLFLQVNAPARLSAAIARGFFCWLGRC